MGEQIALWILVAQGFFIVYYEFDVWRMNKHRFYERAGWREAKRKQQVKKEATGAIPNSNV